MVPMVGWPLVDFEKSHAGHAVGRLLPFFHWLMPLVDVRDQNQLSSSSENTLVGGAISPS